MHRNVSPKASGDDTEEESVVFLHILGEAKDIRDIAEMIERLETIPFLEKAPFRSIDRQQDDSLEETEKAMMSFEIIARVNTGAGAKI